LAAVVAEAAAVIRITPVHNAVWGYVEWCCERGLRFPKLDAVAVDLARDERSVRGAFADLEAWGVLTTREDCRHARVVRLGDGRETARVGCERKAA
jgi:hypothetical protein